MARPIKGGKKMRPHKTGQWTAVIRGKQKYFGVLGPDNKRAREASYKKALVLRLPLDFGV